MPILEDLQLLMLWEDLQLLLFSFAGAIVAFAAATVAYLTRVKNAYLRYSDKLAKRESTPLAPFEIPASWITSGSPVFRSNVFGASHDKSTSSGLWECTGPCEFTWQYGKDESIYILEGFAQVEYLGREFTLSPGDCTHFAAGTVSKWSVPDRVKKSYTLYEPGRFVRKMRRLLRILGVNALPQG